MRYCPADGEMAVCFHEPELEPTCHHDPATTEHEWISINSGGDITGSSMLRDI
jgi:hypothetical protein